MLTIWFSGASIALKNIAFAKTNYSRVQVNLNQYT